MLEEESMLESRGTRSRPGRCFSTYVLARRRRVVRNTLGLETITTRTSGTRMNHEAVMKMDAEFDWWKVHDHQRHAIIAQSLRG